MHPKTGTAPRCASGNPCPSSVPTATVRLFVQPWVKQATCASDLTSLCNASSPVQSRALLYGFSPGSCTGTNPSHLTEAPQDIANFLLVRV